MGVILSSCSSPEREKGEKESGIGMIKKIRGGLERLHTSCIDGFLPHIACATSTIADGALDAWLGVWWRHDDPMKMYVLEEYYDLGFSLSDTSSERGQSFRFSDKMTWS